MVIEIMTIISADYLVLTIFLPSLVKQFVHQVKKTVARQVVQATPYVQPMFSNKKTCMEVKEHSTLTTATGGSAISKNLQEV